MRLLKVAHLCNTMQGIMTLSHRQWMDFPSW